MCSIWPCDQPANEKKTARKKPHTYDFAHSIVNIFSPKIKTFQSGSIDTTQYSISQINFKMKRLSLLLLVFISLNLYGQKNTVGIFGGINHSLFRFDNNEYFIPIDSLYSPMNSFNYGVHFTHDFSKRIAVRVELMYQKMGGCPNSNFVSVTGDRFGVANLDIRSFLIIEREQACKCDVLNYIKVPFMLQYSFFEKIKMDISIGQSIGYLFEWESEYLYEDKSYDSNRFDYSLLAGVGLSIPLSERIGIQINLRASRGINDIGKDLDVEIRNEEYSAMIGIDYLINSKY